MPKEKRFDIKIDVASNGSMVTIKDYKGVIDSRVFEGKDHIERSRKWMDKVCRENRTDKKFNAHKKRENAD